VGPHSAASTGLRAPTRGFVGVENTHGPEVDRVAGTYRLMWTTFAGGNPLNHVEDALL